MHVSLDFWDKKVNFRFVRSNIRKIRKNLPMRRVLTLESVHSDELMGLTKKEEVSIFFISYDWIGPSMQI